MGATDPLPPSRNRRREGPCLRPHKHFTLRLALVLITWMTITGTSSATVDGGTTASLLGTAHDGNWAILVEHSVQADCSYEACTVYAIDTRQSGFERRLLVKVPPRTEALKRELCDGLDKRECGMLVAKQLQKEAAELATPTGGTRPFDQRLVARYVAQLTVWQRALLGKVAPPPRPHQLDPTKDDGDPKSTIRLTELGPQALVIRIKERWTVPSFRALTEDNRYCDPARLGGCEKELRWVDGERTQRWVCPAPSPEAKAPDCSGRASMVRVEASWEDGATELGRSSLVEPGVIASYGVGMVPSRKVPVSSLVMRRHALTVYRLSQAWLVVGSFGEGIQGNGTWFPLVVAVPSPSAHAKTEASP